MYNSYSFDAKEQRNILRKEIEMDPMSKGVQKFCSYFILKCKKCGERFTILRDYPDSPYMSTAEKGVAYCPFCGKRSNPELWTKLK